MIIWIIGRSGGQKAKRGQDECSCIFLSFFQFNLFFYSFFLSRETFLQIETQLTYYTTFISRTHLQNQQILYNFRFRYFRIFFSREIDVCCFEVFIFIFHLFLFIFWPFLDLDGVAMIRGTQTGYFRGIFCGFFLYFYLFSFLGRLGLGNHGKDFARNLVKLGLHFVQNRVDLGFV